jgi:hypothetical protein
MLAVYDYLAIIYRGSKFIEVIHPEEEKKGERLSL